MKSLCRTILDSGHSLTRCLDANKLMNMLNFYDIVEVINRSSSCVSNCISKSKHGFKIKL